MCILLATPNRSGLHPSHPGRTTMPSADFRTAVRQPLSPHLETRHRPPGVGPSAFIAHPPDLQSRPLTDMDFVTSCSLVRPDLPLIRFLFVESRLCSTLPSDPASRRRPCASLTLLLRQDGWRTFTSKLPFMPGTQEKPPVINRRPSSVGVGARIRRSRT